jgi:hypothetical protein
MYVPHTYCGRLVEPNNDLCYDPEHRNYYYNQATYPGNGDVKVGEEVYADNADGSVEVICSARVGNNFASSSGDRWMVDCAGQIKGGNGKVSAFVYNLSGSRHTINGYDKYHGAAL